MKYELEIEIDLPRDRVIELFDNPDNLKKWQEGLVSFEPLDGVPGQPGATSRLEFQMGKRTIEMVETITKRNLPDEFSGTYEAKGVWNSVENHFSEPGPSRTHWMTKHEFRCQGFIRVLAFFFPGMFKKQSFKFMRDFKKFAEGEGAG